MDLAINLYTIQSILYRAGIVHARASGAIAGIEIREGSRRLAHPLPEGGSDGSASSSLGSCARPDTIGGKSQGNIAFSGGVIT